MKFLSPAKLNLNLRVISKRIDGYHNLETAFQFIDLFDEITFRKVMNLSILAVMV